MKGKRWLFRTAALMVLLIFFGGVISGEAEE